MSGTGFDRVGLSLVAMNAAGVLALVTTANNPDGLILRTAVLQAVTTTAQVELYADTAAPAAAGDVTKAMIAMTPAQNTPFVLPREIVVPAGHGLWAVSTNGNAFVHITYDLVPSV